MGQITIYLDDATENEMKEAARSRHLSLSHWIARIIEENIRAKWPQEILNFPGSWKDDSAFGEIRTNVAIDAEREEL